MHQEVQRMTTLLIRRLWTICKKILIDDGAAKQELLFAQDAFYNGARSVLEVLTHMLEHAGAWRLGRAPPHHQTAGAPDRCDSEIRTLLEKALMWILPVSPETSIPARSPGSVAPCAADRVTGRS